jgi:Xaa-Pro aminopeptidase
MSARPRLDIAAVQEALAGCGIDGWLFYDFRRSDPLAYRVLGLPDDRMATRRWFYLIPARGEPVKVVHRIEPDMLEPAPGSRLPYSSLAELEDRLDEILKGRRTLAMQYSPENAIPYVSRVDAGTIEMVRRRGAAVVSSADLVQTFEATMDEAQLRSHIEAAQLLRETVDVTFAEVRRRILDGVRTTEREIQQFMARRFAERGFVCDHPPIVAVNEHSGNPHYSPPAEGSSPIRRGDHFLIDLWCKKDVPGAIYADITWTAFLDAAAPAENQNVFAVVAGGRDAAASYALAAFREGREVRGWEVDDAARSFISGKGYGDRFVHRTGHSLGTEVHGNGANIDHYETKDDRRLIPRTAFTIEPGVYLPRFGVRSEIDVYVGAGDAVVTGQPIQTRLEPLLA